MVLSGLNHVVTDAVACPQLVLDGLPDSAHFPGTVDCAKYFAIHSYEDLYGDVDRGRNILKTLTLCAASVLTRFLRALRQHCVGGDTQRSAGQASNEDFIANKKNGGAMMKVARHVSDPAASEVSLMKESQLENNREAGVELNARLTALQLERKAAYAHFQRLLAAPPNSD